MSWYNNIKQVQAPTASPQLIQMASQSPLTALSKGMSELMNVVDERAKDKYTTSALESLKGVNNTNAYLKGVNALDTTRMNDKGLLALDRLGKNITMNEQSKAREFTQGMQEDNYNLNVDKFENSIKQQGITNQLNEDKFGLEEKLKNAQIAKANRVDQPSTIREMKALGFPLTEEGYVSFVNAKTKATKSSFGEVFTQYDKNGKPIRQVTAKSQADLDKYSNDSSYTRGKDIQADGKVGKRDLLEQMTVAFQKSNPNATPEEVASFNKEALNRIKYGSSDTSSEKNLKELTENFVQVQTYKKNYLNKPLDISNADMGNMKALENDNFDKLQDKQKVLLKDNIKSMSDNFIVVTNIDKALSKPSVKVVDKDIIADTKTWVEKKIGKETAQSMDNVDFNTRTGRILLSYLKSTSGTAVSDMERQFIQDVMLGGDLTDEKYVLKALKTFRDSIVDENDTKAGIIFDDAPYSANKFRRYNTNSSNASSIDTNSIFR